MEPITISVRGYTPRTYSTKGELEWCKIVAQETGKNAIKDLVRIPLESTFSVTLHFYRGLENKQYDGDNLAKPVIDTLFYGREENKRNGETKLPFGALFPDRPQGRKDLSDFYVFEEHIHKHLENELAKQGVDIIVELREVICS